MSRLRKCIILDEDLEVRIARFQERQRRIEAKRIKMGWRWIRVDANTIVLRKPSNNCQ